jgi:hypothetical protein
MKRFNSDRYYQQSTLSRLIDSQEAHGRTQKELEAARKEIDGLKAEIEALIRQMGRNNKKTSPKEEDE